MTFPTAVVKTLKVRFTFNQRAETKWNWSMKINFNFSYRIMPD